MKKLGEQLELLFDWFVPFYERVLPKKPPKIPTHACMRAAATIADDKDPSSVPERGENTGYLPSSGRLNDNNPTPSQWEYNDLAAEFPMQQNREDVRRNSEQKAA